ncbi:MAG: DUF1667 domain-containing protein [Christensenella sp.]|uniref:DUF1667 domain-containing protein n=1 Tax=Christensenella sp. TaxID=1935934 RepID=UPI002B20C4EB|nr:DUF1667 domain-containing protein [Christensenella sp.]MEA5003139.1 DUF1667 domain-containing protein [Christensenella sp.]
MKEFTCIVCPKGCRIVVDDTGIRGAGCERGVEYVTKEMRTPVRMATSTVRLTGSSLPRLPVKTSAPIEKRMLMRAVKLLNDVTVTAPVKCGDVVLKDILGTGIDFVATKSACRL